MATIVRPKITTRRKKKPPVLAVINECCTGCAGSPACQQYCPVENCMVLVEDEPTGFCRIEVDPLLCIGCKKCTSKGPDGAFLDGCPWNAIDMIDIKDYEAEHGALPY